MLGGICPEGGFSWWGAGAGLGGSPLGAPPLSHPPPLGVPAFLATNVCSWQLGDLVGVVKVGGATGYHMSAMCMAVTSCWPLH